ncbi:hypothetical protein BU15DRAFT_62052 [Melanogaster broomeanus]|nr:hypothetical protein BU15DRAFT_62052 [Melanogaster broomeanus]
MAKLLHTGRPAAATAAKDRNFLPQDPGGSPSFAAADTDRSSYRSSMNWLFPDGMDYLFFVGHLISIKSPFCWLEEGSVEIGIGVQPTLSTEYFYRANLTVSIGYDPRLARKPTSLGAKLEKTPTLKRRTSFSLIRLRNPLQMTFLMIDLDDGTIIDVSDLSVDGRNWKTYYESILQVAALENHELKAWEQRNKIGKFLITNSIPDSLLMCVMHLETAREWFKYLADRFEMNTSDVTRREAICNPRRRIGTHKKCSERTHKLRECEATANKPESTIAVEPRDSTRRERKHEARDQRGCKPRGHPEQPGRRWQGYRSPLPTHGTPETRWDITSSQQGPADAANPNATSARPAEPAGTSHELRDEPHESTGSYPGSRGESDDSRGPGAHCMRVTVQRPQTANPTAGEAVADVANPNAMSASHKPQDAPQGIAGDNISPEVWEVDETIARGPSEAAADEMTDDISLAARASSPSKPGVATPMDNATNATAAPWSIPLKGERDAQRCTNGARTGQRHGAIARGEGPSAWAERHTSCTRKSSPRVPDGIIEDPGGRSEPGAPDRPPSMLLKGEQSSSGYTDDGTAARVRRANTKGLQGYLEAE